MDLISPANHAVVRKAESSAYFDSARDLAQRMPSVQPEHKRAAGRAILRRLQYWLKHAEAAKLWGAR